MTVFPFFALFTSKSYLFFFLRVRLYQELVIPHFTLKHAQYAAVAVTTSGANKLLKKVWEAIITKRDKLILREHAKVVQIKESLIQSSKPSKC